MFCSYRGYMRNLVLYCRSYLDSCIHTKLWHPISLPFAYNRTFVLPFKKQSCTVVLDFYPDIPFWFIAMKIYCVLTNVMTGIHKIVLKREYMCLWSPNDLSLYWLSKKIPLQRQTAEPLTHSTVSGREQTILLTSGGQWCHGDVNASNCKLHT